MKKRLFNITIALFALSMPVMAIENSKETAQPEKSSLGTDWYIEMGVGAQVFFSKDASILKFGKRITPALSITGGKWFSPFWGARLQAQGYSLNGFSTPQGLYVNDPLDNGLIYGPNDPVRDIVAVRPDGSYRRYLRYMNLHADFQVSLINLIAGYQPERKWDIIPAVGIGYIHSFPHKGTAKVNSISTNFSLMGKYKLPKGFDVNMELQTALMPDRFDGRIVGKSYENNCALTVGVTYHFKKRSFKPVTIKAPEKDLRETLREIIHEELQTQAPMIYNRNGIRDTVVVTQKVSAEPVKSKGEPFTLASFLFNSGKAEPINGQEIQFVNIAEYLKKYPKAKIRLEGYADKQTGNADANLHLSMRRAMKIRSLLIDNYGIDTKRIETQGIGINYQPYKENDWNRVVIVTVVDE